jgi:hypothetical protein
VLRSWTRINLFHYLNVNRSGVYYGWLPGTSRDQLNAESQFQVPV